MEERERDERGEERDERRERRDEKRRGEKKRGEKRRDTDALEAKIKLSGAKKLTMNDTHSRNGRIT